MTMYHLDFPVVCLDEWMVNGWVD